jgi:hypothetical protein
MDDNDSSAVQEEKEGTAKDAQYLKIVGQIKDYDGKKSLVAQHSICKIENEDQITQEISNSRTYRRHGDTCFDATNEQFDSTSTTVGRPVAVVVSRIKC